MSQFFIPTGAAYSSNKDDWETPQTLFDQLDAHYHFTIDVAANEQNHKTACYYTKADDGLSLPSRMVQPAIRARSNSTLGRKSIP